MRDLCPNTRVGVRVSNRPAIAYDITVTAKIESFNQHATDGLSSGGHWAADGYLLPFDQDLRSFVSKMRARENLHQGRFAGAVLSHKRMDLAESEIEGYVF
jgi:hypothetical protein